MFGTTEQQKQEAGRVPLDIEALQKGDVITCDELSRILKIGPSHPMWKLKVLALGDHIRREKERLLSPVVVCVRKDELIILTDEQAVGYTDCKCEKAKRRYRRGLKDMQVIDNGKLTEETKKDWLKNMRVRSMGLMGLKLGERGKIKLEPHKRKTPLLEGKN
jgi:hypothetical protein